MKYTNDLPLYSLLNEYRLVPRLMLAGYGWLMWDVSMWFMALKDPTATQAAFVSTMVGVSGALFGLYTKAKGNDG